MIGHHLGWRIVIINCCGSSRYRRSIHRHLCVVTGLQGNTSRSGSTSGQVIVLLLLVVVVVMIGQQVVVIV